MIRPALTNYFSNIAGKRQGFAGGLNSTFTSMGNFIGPLVAGALFDVNLEFPLYMAIAVSLSGIIIIFIEKDLSHVVKKQINTQGPQQKNFTRNSTDKASWGLGPQQKNFTEKFTDKASLDGRGGTQCSR